MRNTKTLSKKQKKKAILFAVIFYAIMAAALSFAGAVYLGVMLKQHTLDVNMESMKALLTSGQFPMGIFWILFAAFTIVMLYVYLQSKKNQEGVQDDLGRSWWRPKERQTYGDAHFEQPEEYADLAVVTDITDDKCIGPIFGQLSTDASECVSWITENTRNNANILVIGPSGSGKTFGFAKPYLYQCVRRRESIIVTDPDGGLYHDTRGFLQKQGYIVRTLNLKKFSQSHGWDCMKSVSFGDIEVNSQIFANTIIKNATDSKKTEQIYRDGPMLLIKALVLRVMLGEDFPPEKKNIQTVYNILKRPDATDYIDSLFDEITMPPAAKVSRGPWDSFCLGGPNVKANIMMNLATNLQVLQSELVSSVLSTDEIDLNLPGHEPCAYFCQFPDSDSTFKFIVSLFFTMIFYTLTEQADNNHKNDRKLDVPVNFLLDEFPSIGILPDWDKKMSTVRKRDIHVAMICQSITQIQNLYEDCWDNITGNCATWLALGINDFVTAQQFSNRVGTATVQSQSEQHNVNEPVIRLFGMKNHSSGEGKRNLLDPYELFELPKDDSVIIFQGHGPVYAHKFPHTLHPYAKMLGDISDDMGDLPDFNDKNARALRTKKEDAVLEGWKAAHPDGKPDPISKISQKSKKERKKDPGRKKGKNSKNDTQPDIKEEPVSMEMELEEISLTPAEAPQKQETKPSPEEREKDFSIDTVPSKDKASRGFEPTKKKPKVTSMESELEQVKKNSGPPPKNADFNFSNTTTVKKAGNKDKQRTIAPDKYSADLEEIAPPKKQPANKKKDVPQENTATTTLEISGQKALAQDKLNNIAI